MEKQYAGKPQPAQIIAIAGAGRDVDIRLCTIKLGMALGQLGRRILSIRSEDSTVSERQASGTLSGPKLPSETDWRSRIRKGSGGVDQLRMTSPQDDRAVRKAKSVIAGAGNEYDTLLIEIADVTDPSVTPLISMCDQLLVVMNSDPESLATSYGLIKKLRQEKLALPVLAIVNRASSHEAGMLLFKKMQLMVEKFLRIKLDLGAVLLGDEVWDRAETSDIQLLLGYQRSQPAGEMLRFAQRLLRMPYRDIHRNNPFQKKWEELRNLYIGTANV